MSVIGIIKGIVSTAFSVKEFADKIRDEPEEDDTKWMQQQLDDLLKGQNEIKNSLEYLLGTIEWQAVEETIIPQFQAILFRYAQLQRFDSPDYDTPEKRAQWASDTKDEMDRALSYIESAILESATPSHQSLWVEYVDYLGSVETGDGHLKQSKHQLLYQYMLYLFQIQGMAYACYMNARTVLDEISDDLLERGQESYGNQLEQQGFPLLSTLNPQFEVNNNQRSAALPGGIMDLKRSPVQYYDYANNVADEGMVVTGIRFYLEPPNTPDEPYTKNLYVEIKQAKPQPFGVTLESSDWKRSANPDMRRGGRTADNTPYQVSVNMDTDDDVDNFNNITVVTGVQLEYGELLKCSIQTAKLNIETGELNEASRTWTKGDQVGMARALHLETIELSASPGSCISGMSWNHRHLSNDFRLAYQFKTFCVVDLASKEQGEQILSDLRRDITETA
ncbi:hypothetical protein [Candidatus Albibeggiatoa sp. nov. BB20]|uniref:hypothetical protein n=1 Tax=Candidatus Albibeggiatoa sp. nov. BB20 TaxID=3162723 RepID=UPI00336534EB